MNGIKVFCSALSALVFYNTLQSSFVYDDSRAILKNGDILPSAPWSNLLQDDFWGTSLSHNGSHKSYRPLCTLTFKLNYLISGFQPWGYHLVNLILHVMVTHLFTTLAESMHLSPLSVLICGSMFALHPVHCEAVAGVVGRADLLAAVFFISAILSFKSHCRNRNVNENKKWQCSSTVSSSSECEEFTAVKTHSYDRNGNFVTKKKSQKLTKAERPSPKRPQASGCVLYRENIFLLLTVIFATCSMLSKEHGITALGVCFAMDLAKWCQKIKSVCKMIESSVHTKKKVKSLFTLISVTLFLLFMRARVMGYSSPTFATADNPAAASDSVKTRALTFLFLPAFNFALLLCPSTLSFDWSMNSIELVKSFNDVRNVASLLFYSALAIVVVRLSKKILGQSESKVSKKKRVEMNVQVLGLSIMIFSFLPATNAFFYVGFVVAERVLYIPSIGFSLLCGTSIASIIESSRGKRQMVSICLTVFFLFCFGVRTLERNADWKNEERLYRAGIKINPPKALGNLGNVLTQTGRFSEAEWSFKKALQFRPNMADVHYNLGVLLQQQKRLNEAVDCYKLAIHYRQKLALAHLNLALSYAELNLKPEAVAILLRVQDISDDGTKDPLSHVTTQVSALFNAGRILLDLGRPLKALHVLQKAEEQGKKIGFGSQQGILNLLGEAYQALNNTGEAERYYRAALTQKPDHIPAYLTYGKMLAKNKTRHHEAEHWFNKANEIAPDDANVHLHFGFFLLDSQRNFEAALQFEKAVNIRPDDYESNFNAGVSYRLAEKYELAEKFYRQAMQLRPQDPSSHMNLGAMLHLVGKLSEAEGHYLMAWSLNPGDQATRTNIQRLHNIMRKKGLAVKKVEPSEDF